MRGHAAYCRVDIYGWDVYFFNDRKAAVAQLRRDEVDDDHLNAWADEQSTGLCSQWPKRSCIYIGVFSGRAGTLAHECVHAAMHILERADIPAYWSNHEALSYLVGYLVDVYTNATTKRRRKK